MTADLLFTHVLELSNFQFHKSSLALPGFKLNVENLFRLDCGFDLNIDQVIFSSAILNYILKGFSVKWKRHF